jgi:hypothetical protein
MPGDMVTIDDVFGEAPETEDRPAGTGTGRRSYDEQCASAVLSQVVSYNKKGGHGTEFVKEIGMRRSEQGRMSLQLVNDASAEVNGGYPPVHLLCSKKGYDPALAVPRMGLSAASYKRYMARTQKTLIEALEADGFDEQLVAGSALFLRTGTRCNYVFMSTELVGSLLVGRDTLTYQRFSADGRSYIVLPRVGFCGLYASMMTGI